MEYISVVDKERDEYIHIYVHEKNELVERIESIIEKPGHMILRYKDEEILRFNLMETSYFFYKQ